MFERWAKHLTVSAESHGGKYNWMNADTEQDLQRFREGAARHFEQWLNGENAEDHAAAILFNINGAEYVRERLKRD